ncbi:MAG: flagellar filament capping protein FliD [Lachnospiraceae bacterium]|nr:flagellar filament capping protein FliD [Lachnospiraceae bacterium]
MAVNVSALNQVYNHYLTEYAPKTNTPLDTHKKSDLRSIYNSIVKMNKESPLYLLDKSPASKAYAVGLKESARIFRNSVLSTQSSIDEKNVLEQKKAYSSHPEIASAKYIGMQEDGNEASAPTFRLEVAELAKNQVNTGNTLVSDERIGLAEGSYSFDVSIKDISYEFQFELHGDDTNIEVQNRLQRLIQSANIGLEASVLEDSEGNSSLKLESVSTGLTPDKDILFEISDENTSKTKGIVDYLGLDQISQPPSNALFEVNGIERTASSNTFTVEKVYEITLNGPSSEPGMTTEIGLKTDVESLSENIHSLADSYNQFIDDVSSNPGSHSKSTQLMSEISRITRHYSAGLNAIGLSFSADGHLSIDDAQMQTAASEADSSENFSSVKDFANSMLRKSNQITLNPMQYVNKTIVAYKNPGKNYPSPYITSAYSGMLFNNYC